MKNKLAAFFAAIFMAVGFFAVTSPASAAIGPGDDRQMTTPTSWWTYTGLTVAQIEAQRLAHNARITDIQVYDAASHKFTVVMVRNTGSYASGWWYYVGLTQSQVIAKYTTHNARLISAEAYNTSSGIRYAVIMISNTGLNAKAWWWYHGTTTFLSGKLSAHSARMINVSQYPGGGYLGIMVNNTGSNAAPGGWHWYVGASVASINSHLTANHARIIDLSRNSNGTWNAVMYHNAGTRWYQFFNYTLPGAVTKANQLGERIIDATPYTLAGQQFYAVVMTDDLDAASDALWSIIGPKVDSGAYGFYLKMVGGPALAGLQASTQYEPASALKVLYHAKSIHEESLGNSSDAAIIVYHFNPAKPTNPGICPDDFFNILTTNLKNADTQMMQVSDNRMTRGIVEKYTKAAMLNYAATLGLTSTVINHNIGCPTAATHNKTTLVDLGKVYEAFQTGVVTGNGFWVTQFKSRMLNQSNYGGFQSAICPIVQQEATSLGKSATVATNFCNAMSWIAKGGSYQYGSKLPYTVSWDGLALTGVPYMVSRTLTPKYFIFGEYVDGTTINSQSEADKINAARGKLFLEALRPYIREALADW